MRKKTSSKLCQKKSYEKPEKNINKFHIFIVFPNPCMTSLIK